MGIDTTAIESILISLRHVSDTSAMLTLGRQGIHIPRHVVDYFLRLYNLDLDPSYYQTYSEVFFQAVGFQSIDSIDNSAYEKATIVHNLNFPIPASLQNKYTYIYDGGTTEHCFNTAQVFQNIIDMLKVGGIVCSVVPNNNQSGHGLYQFSPEFFLSVFANEYGMMIREMYIAVSKSDRSTWIDVNDLKNCQSGRQQARFKTNEEVFVITVAEKTHESKQTLLTDPPNQYSYEQIEWRNKL